MGEADAVADGLADVGVVQEPVDGGRGEGFGHQLVERGGVEVGRDRDGSFLVGGVDEPVEALGGCKLVGDITYIRTWAGWVYLATVLDCATNPEISRAARAADVKGAPDLR